MMKMSNYIPTVGIEVHCELKTNTKIFSNSINGYGQMANSLTNVVDLGYPGTLPTLNKEVLKEIGLPVITKNLQLRKSILSVFSYEHMPKFTPLQLFTQIICLLQIFGMLRHSRSSTPVSQHHTHIFKMEVTH